MTLINHRYAFLKIFNTTARYHHRHKVFEDFVSCAAIALHNGVGHDAELEKQYLSIIAGYKKEDVTRMVELLGHVVMALDQERCDFLGSVFMELELGDKYRGQFFTPWDVSRMMASLQLSGIDALMQERWEFASLQNFRTHPEWLVHTLASCALPRRLINPPLRPASTALSGLFLKFPLLIFPPFLPASAALCGFSAKLPAPPR